MFARGLVDSAPGHPAIAISGATELIMTRFRHLIRIVIPYGINQETQISHVGQDVVFDGEFERDNFRLFAGSELSFLRLL